MRSELISQDDLLFLLNCLFKYFLIYLNLFYLKEILENAQSHLPVDEAVIPVGIGFAIKAVFIAINCLYFLNNYTLKTLNKSHFTQLFTVSKSNKAFQSAKAEKGRISKFSGTTRLNKICRIKQKGIGIRKNNGGSYTASVGKGETTKEKSEEKSEETSESKSDYNLEKMKKNINRNILENDDFEYEKLIEQFIFKRMFYAFKKKHNNMETYVLKLYTSNFNVYMCHLKDVIHVITWFFSFHFWKRDKCDVMWDFGKTPAYIFKVLYTLLTISCIDLTILIICYNKYKESIIKSAILIDILFCTPSAVFFAKHVFLLDIYAYFYFLMGFMKNIKVFLNVSYMKVNHNSMLTNIELKVIRIVLGIFLLCNAFAATIFTVQGLNPTEQKENSLIYFINIYIEYFYFAIISISTVGYGDIFPTIQLSKIICLIFIFWAFLWVPIQVNDIIMNVISKRMTYGRVCMKNQKFLLLIGDVDPYTLSIFLFEAYAYKSKLKFHVLTTYPIQLYEDQIKLADYFSTSLYIKNADLNEKGNLSILTNIKANDASHLFLFCSKRTHEHYNIDTKSFMRLSILNNYLSQRKNVMVELRNNAMSTMINSMGFKNFIIEKLKYSLIVKNIVCPGTVTFILNLFTAYDFDYNYDFPRITQNDKTQFPSFKFIDEFIKGTRAKIFSFPVHKNMIGLNFDKLFHKLYDSLGIILLGVETTAFLKKKKKKKRKNKEFEIDSPNTLKKGKGPMQRRKKKKKFTFALLHLLNNLSQNHKPLDPMYSMYSMSSIDSIDSRSKRKIRKQHDVDEYVVDNYSTYKGNDNDNYNGYYDDYDDYDANDYSDTGNEKRTGTHHHSQEEEISKRKKPSATSKRGKKRKTNTYNRWPSFMSNNVSKKRRRKLSKIYADVNTTKKAEQLAETYLSPSFKKKKAQQENVFNENERKSVYFYDWKKAQEEDEAEQEEEDEEEEEEEDEEEDIEDETEEEEEEEEEGVEDETEDEEGVEDETEEEKGEKREIQLSESDLKENKQERKKRKSNVKCYLNLLRQNYFMKKNDRCIIVANSPKVVKYLSNARDLFWLFEIKNRTRNVVTYNLKSVIKTEQTFNHFLSNRNKLIPLKTAYDVQQPSSTNNLKTIKIEQVRKKLRETNVKQKEQQEEEEEEDKEEEEENRKIKKKKKKNGYRDRDWDRNRDKHRIITTRKKSKPSHRETTKKEKIDVIKLSELFNYQLPQTLSSRNLTKKIKGNRRKYRILRKHIINGEEEEEEKHSIHIDENKNRIYTKQMKRYANTKKKTHSNKKILSLKTILKKKKNKNKGTEEEEEEEEEHEEEMTNTMKTLHEKLLHVTPKIKNENKKKQKCITMSEKKERERIRRDQSPYPKKGRTKKKNYKEKTYKTRNNVMSKNQVVESYKEAYAKYFSKKRNKLLFIINCNMNVIYLIRMIINKYKYNVIILNDEIPNYTSMDVCKGKVVFIKCKSLDDHNLINAGLIKANYILIAPAHFDDMNKINEIDMNTIILTRKVIDLLKKKKKNFCINNIITEILNPANAIFLDNLINNQLKIKRSPYCDFLPYVYSTYFRSSNIICETMLYNFMTHRPIFTKFAAHSETLTALIKHLHIIPLSHLKKYPDFFFESIQSFQQLFNFLSKKNIITLGLYRRGDKNTPFYVYTKPDEKCVLRCDDLILAV